MKLFLIYLVLSQFIIINSIKVNDQLKKVKEKGNDPEAVPIINVHMEEPDRDPVEVKRYEEDRRVERNRIRDLEAREEMDTRAFQQIISLQTAQLGKLTNIAESTSQILRNLAHPAPAAGNDKDLARFKEKEERVHFPKLMEKQELKNDALDKVNKDSKIKNQSNQGNQGVIKNKNNEDGQIQKFGMDYTNRVQNGPVSPSEIA